MSRSVEKVYSECEKYGLGLVAIRFKACDNIVNELDLETWKANKVMIRRIEHFDHEGMFIKYLEGPDHNSLKVKVAAAIPVEFKIYPWWLQADMLQKRLEKQPVRDVWEQIRKEVAEFLVEKLGLGLGDP
jgi:hypothetical protein